MLSRIERLLRIVYLLLSHGRIAAPDLAERFGVSIKTVYRDIDTLCLAGIPIVSHAGSRGGYALMDSYVVDKGFYTRDELAAFLPVLEGIGHLFDDHTVLDVKEKLLAILPEGQRNALVLMMDRFIFDPSPWGDDGPTKAKLSLIRTALAENRTLRFGYTNLKGVQRPRHAAPLAIVFKGQAWYLKAFCMDAQDGRLFKLSRMRMPVITDEGFDPAAYRTLSSRDVNEVSGFAELPMVRVTMQVSPAARVRVEEQIDASRVEEDPEGRLIARIHYPEEEELYRMLLSFGADVRVLEPPHIIRGLRERSLAIARQYDSERRIPHKPE